MELGETELSKAKIEDGPDISDSGSESLFNLFAATDKQNDVDGGLYDESFFKESEDMKDVTSVKNDWSDDRTSIIN